MSLFSFTGGDWAEPSGEFAPVTEWSCPLHDEPQTHECNCDRCEIGHYTCATCADAEWRDKLDEDGNVVTRELTKGDVAMRAFWRRAADDMFGKSHALVEMLNRDPADYTVSWGESGSFPLILSDNDGATEGGAS